MIASKPKNDNADPVVAAFLQFMGQQMPEHPEEVVPSDADQLRRIGRLVEGVNTR